MTYLTFTDRDTYLAARAEWRADYAALSKEIRNIKREISAKQKESGSGAAAGDQCSREYLRGRARQMMAVRQEMKEQSAAQWTARQTEKIAA